MSEDPKPTILIVDDEPSNVRVLVELLRNDARLRTATSGPRALEIARSDDPPDLILLDGVMPELDGWDTCRQLRADPRTAGIPVVFISGQHDEAAEVRGFEAGAVDYVAKPFRPVVVRARVKTQLELKRLRDRLEAESRLDPLTGVANRRRFEEALDANWALALRDEASLALIMIDVDHFKPYNDRFGHAEGDRCLQRVATALAEGTRRASDLVARWGGEEFACLLPATTLEGGLQRAEAYRHAVESLVDSPSEGGTLRAVTISLGVAALVPGVGQSPGRLVRSADSALYRAKEAGRNTVVGYS